MMVYLLNSNIILIFITTTSLLSLKKMAEENKQGTHTLTKHHLTFRNRDEEIFVQNQQNKG